VASSNKGSPIKDMISDYSGIDLLSLDMVHRKESKVKTARVNFAEIDEEEEKLDDGTEFESEELSR